MSDSSSEDHSRPDSPSGSTGKRPKGQPERRPDTDLRRSFLDELLRRRVPQVLAGYLGAAWTLFELLQWMANQYLLSPYLGQAILFGLLLLLPSVLMVTYRHGQPGPDPWTQSELYGIAGNLVVALLILAFAFAGVELGSMVRTVRTTAADTAGSNASEATANGTADGDVVRQVPKKQFRRRVALFYFGEAEGARADTALRRAAPTALRADLEQDPFVSIFSPARFDEELQRRGYKEGLGVPLGLKQEAARNAGAGYILSGHVGETGSGEVLLKTELRETETGDLTAEHRFEAKNFFDAIDRASAQLKRDLGLPDGHLESTTDLPVTQVFTSSVAAAEHYAQGYHFQRFGENTSRRAAQEYGRATSADTTFALGYLREGEALWVLGKRGQAREAFESARRHSYRLPESRKYEQKALRLYRLEGRPEAALQVCERWTSLHPYDLDGWKMKAGIQSGLLRHEQALASYQRALELAPESKSMRRIILEVLMRTGQLENALQRAKSYAESYPKDVRGPLLLGRIHWQRGELERAEHAFRRAERMDARDARTYLLALNQARGQFEAALSKIKKEVSDGQDRIQAELRLSHHHWLRGRIGRSQDVLDSLWTDGPERPGGVYRYNLAIRACDYYGPLGKRSYVSDLLGRLRTLWQEASTSTPGYEIIAQAALARCKIAVGKLKEAQQHLDQATTLIERPGTPLWYRLTADLDYIWGRLREAQGRHEDAATRYSQYIEDSSLRSLLFRTLGLPRLRLALAYQRTGRSERAKATYEEALALRPSHPRLNYHYAQFLKGRGLREAAWKHLQRALEGWAPADPDFRPRQEAEALADSLGRSPV